MKNHREILEAVIAKGGLLGICGRRYIHDEHQAIHYIIELSEQCHAENIQQFWGGHLVDAIRIFSQHHHLLNSKKEYNDDS